MAVMCVQIAETAGRAVGRTEPDVHLIKQVEQVTMPALGGPTWRLARIPSRGRGPLYGGSTNRAHGLPSCSSAKFGESDPSPRKSGLLPRFQSESLPP